MSMEGNSSGGEELVAVKTRKPYTITKQRERWTEEEHNLFIEALRLYGRSWQRIEEHIGTKTAVQIRSHAQKFFTKLEKEALEKGTPPGQTHEIDIPPPRPKRKPASPYPRKSSTGTFALIEELNGKSSKTMSILSKSNEMDAMSDAPRKFTAPEMVLSKEISEDASCSEVVNVFQDASPSVSSAKKTSSNCSKYMEFLPTNEKVVEKIATDKSSTPHEVVKELKENGVGQDANQGNLTKPQLSLDLAEGGKTLNLQDLTSKDTDKGDQTHQTCAVCYIDETNMKTQESADPNPPPVTSQVGVQANAYPSMNTEAIPIHSVFPMGSMNHPLPAFIPFTYFHGDQAAYRSFLNMPSTFSSLIVSTLLQNPAFHAAATLAASFWPSAVMETSHSTPEIGAGEIPERHMNSAPTLEAIASATVSAAAAWWSSQGLLPWFPGNSGVVLVSPQTNGVLSACTARGPVYGGTIQTSPREIQQDGDEKNSETLNAEHHSSKLVTLSSAYFDDDGGGDHENDPKGTRSSKSKPSQASGFPDSDKDRRKKKQDGSSCGSNTTSSSEKETNMIEKKEEKVNPGGKEASFSNLPNCEANHRKFRSSGSMNESWKEVSQEGRLAFQELFKREVLPQSFASLLTEGPGPATRDGQATESPANVYRKDHLHYDTKEETCISSNDISTAHAKSKVHQTGFKPYKRCSVEAENSAAPVEETGNKRMRLQGEASS